MKIQKKNWGAGRGGGGGGRRVGGEGDCEWRGEVFVKVKKNGGMSGGGGGGRVVRSGVGVGQGGSKVWVGW